MKHTASSLSTSHLRISAVPRLHGTVFSNLITQLKVQSKGNPRPELKKRNCTNGTMWYKKFHKHAESFSKTRVCSITAIYFTDYDQALDYT